VSGAGLPTEERLLDLLASRATEGLDADAGEVLAAELEQQGLDPDGLDLAAAATSLVFLGPVEPLPAAVRARLEAQARSRVGDPDRRGRRRLADGLGWLVAAAAFVLLLVEMPRRPDREPGLLAQRRALESAATDLVRAAFAPGGDPRFAAVAGDVIWSPAEQRGFLRLRGLPANDPGASQYQLWLVDPERDEHPVDGGVFDATGDETVAAVHATVPVGRPVAFAITLEKPGGVVVSRGPLLVVAKVS